MAAIMADEKDATGAPPLGGDWSSKDGRGTPPLLERFLLGLSSACILAALFFGPVAFGGVETWAYATLAVLAYAALAFALAYALLSRTMDRLATPLLIPLLLALLFVGFQCVSWPIGLIAWISPGTAEAYRLAAGPGGEMPGQVSLSLYKYASKGAFLCLSAYIALFAATLICARTRRDLVRFAVAIVAVGALIAVIGILQRLSGTTKIYWWRPVSFGGSLFGPFVSRNQFASFGGVCFFVGLGLLLAYATAVAAAGGWRKEFLRRGSKRVPQLIAYAAATALTGIAVAWSFSRGGLLALVLALAGFFLLMGLIKVRKDKMLYLTAILAVVAGGVIYLGWSRVAERFNTLEERGFDASFSDRLTMFRDAWRIGREFPAAGTGAGTFESVYPRYKTLLVDATATSPHNEYLHVFAEMGLPGVLLLLAALGLFFFITLRGLIRRKNLFERCLLAGGIVAALMVALHSLVDFPMRSPAVACTLAVVAALAVAAARSHDEREAPEEDDAPPGDISYRVFGVLLIALAAFGASRYALGTLHADLQERFILRTTRNLTADSTNTVPFARNCERWVRQHGGGNAALFEAVADFSRAASNVAEDPAEKLILNDTALRVRTTAARLEPMNAYHHFELMGDYLACARLDWALVEAEQACRLLPDNPWLVMRISARFLENGHKEPALSYLRMAEALCAAKGLTDTRGTGVTLDILRRAVEAYSTPATAEPSAPAGQTPASAPDAPQP